MSASRDVAVHRVLRVADVSIRGCGDTPCIEKCRSGQNHVNVTVHTTTSSVAQAHVGVTEQIGINKACSEIKYSRMF